MPFKDFTESESLKVRMAELDRKNREKREAEKAAAAKLAEEKKGAK